MKNDDTRLIDGVFTGLFVPAAERGAPPSKAGQIAMVAGVMMVARVIGGNLTWSSIVDVRDLLYPFSGHAFTNAAKTGATGPTLAQCRTAYNTTLNPWVADTNFFNVTAGIQEWTVPGTGYYRIRARGGGRAWFAGGASQNDVRPEADAIFRLQKGDKLKILVGQLGSFPSASGACPSGSGGSFVESGEQGLLMVAGGAGGNTRAGDSTGVTTQAASSSWHPATPTGQVVETPSQVQVGKAGLVRTYTDGNRTATCGSGAAYNDELAVTASNPRSFKNGGNGGTRTDDTSHFGGFGCGGPAGAYWNTSYSAYGAGGGGGYTGGDGAGYKGANHKGGDGGCFIAAFAEEAVFNTTDAVKFPRHGQVTIDLVG